MLTRARAWAWETLQEPKVTTAADSNREKQVFMRLILSSAVVEARLLEGLFYCGGRAENS
jgi:hypothetical protein